VSHWHSYSFECTVLIWCALQQFISLSYTSNGMPTVLNAGGTSHTESVALGCMQVYLSWQCHFHRLSGRISSLYISLELWWVLWSSVANMFSYPTGVWRERERERESVCVCVCVYVCAHVCACMIKKSEKYGMQEKQNVGRPIKEWTYPRRF
jgi:hypothetical protein